MLTPEFLFECIKATPFTLDESAHLDRLLRAVETDIRLGWDGVYTNLGRAQKESARLQRAKIC